MGTSGVNLGVAFRLAGRVCVGSLMALVAAAAR